MIPECNPTFANTVCWDVFHVWLGCGHNVSSWIHVVTIICCRFHLHAGISVASRKICVKYKYFWWNIYEDKISLEACPHWRHIIKTIDFVKYDINSTVVVVMVCCVMCIWCVSDTINPENLTWVFQCLCCVIKNHGPTHQILMVKYTWINDECNPIQVKHDN